MRYVTNGKGELVVISRSGEILISDQHGRERERHKVPYGALLSIKIDQQVKAGTVLANWDPLTRPVITEFAGKAKFENVEEGVTVAKQVDEVTGLSTLVVIDPKRRGSAKVVRPQVKLIDASGKEIKIPGTEHPVTIGLPVGGLVQVRDGQDVQLDLRVAAKGTRAGARGSAEGVPSTTVATTTAMTLGKSTARSAASTALEAAWSDMAGLRAIHASHCNDMDRKCG